MSPSDRPAVFSAVLFLVAALSLSLARSRRPRPPSISEEGKKLLSMMFVHSFARSAGRPSQFPSLPSPRLRGFVRSFRQPDGPPPNSLPFPRLRGCNMQRKQARP